MLIDTNAACRRGKRGRHARIAPFTGRAEQCRFGHTHEIELRICKATFATDRTPTQATVFVDATRAQRIALEIRDLASAVDALSEPSCAGPARRAATVATCLMELAEPGHIQSNDVARAASRLTAVNWLYATFLRTRAGKRID
jgi:hypothetical protein